MGFRQGENKFTSHAGSTDHIDMLIVSIDNFFYNGKTQPGSFFILASG